MNRIEHILGLSFDKMVRDSFGLTSAYCFCLTPSQACTLLQQCVVSRADLRDSVLRKVCSDIDTTYLDCHKHLLKNWLKQFLKVDSRGRQSLGYCLSTIADHVPLSERCIIQKFFLASKYIGVRKRGYKSVSNDKGIPQKLLLNTWERFSDPECAWLIVKMFPEEFLIENRHSLVSALSEGWQFAKLYLRIGEIKPDLIKELKFLDQISYCYVLAKLGKSLTMKEAIAIIDSNSQDDRFGLLVWSLSRLRMWRALEYVESQLQSINEKKIECIKTKYGI